MKTCLTAFSLAAVLAAAPLAVFAQTAPHIDVSGHAQRVVQPDRFHINIQVASADGSPARARTRVEENMSLVMTGFRNNHALPESIEASTLSIGPHERYQDDHEIVDGTEVKRTASATFTRLEDLRNFIDSLKATGEELQITSTQMTRSDADAIDGQLREEAMRDSQRNAERVAKAYGVKVGALYSVSDQPGRSGGYASALDGITVMPNKIPKIDLQVGSQTMESKIYATFLLDQ
jgi:uncharacterized protein